MKSARIHNLGNPDHLQLYPTLTSKISSEPAWPPTTKERYNLDKWHEQCHDE